MQNQADVIKHLKAKRSRSALARTKRPMRRRTLRAGAALQDRATVKPDTAAARSDTDIKVLIDRNDAVGRAEGTVLRAFTDGCPGLRLILADAIASSCFLAREKAEVGDTSMLIWLGKVLCGQRDSSVVAVTGANGGPVQSERVTVPVNDPIEAARVYQKFMSGDR
jgi:hypothetical protein